MLGTVVNTSTIIVGTLVGSLLNRGIDERYKERTMQGMGLVALSIGISNISKGMNLITNPVVFIIAIALGAIAGEWLDIEGKIENFNKRFERKKSPVQGIVTGIVLFCVGALSIVGPIESALRGDNSMLYANAVLDGITSVILSVNYGIYIGVVALVLFVWQGSIYMGATAIEHTLTPEVLNQLTLLGGIFVLATGINILGLGRIKTLNMLPALLVPFAAKILGII